MSDTVTEMQRSLSVVLTPCGWLYGRVMRLREKLYQSGLKASWEPPVLTVSVGNIGWGGTGKTPVADWLLSWAEAKRLKPVLLTRGYGAQPKSLPFTVSPGALAEEAGDEPLMLARNHPKAHIVVDPNRTRAGQMAAELFNPGLFILDDGFQHMAVKRHLNLTLLRQDDLLEGWNRVIPAGSWREPESALRRADAFMIKADPDRFKELEQAVEDRLGMLFKPLFSFIISPIGVRQVVGKATAKDFGDAPYLLVSGVGEPVQVRETAKKYLGYGPVEHLAFKDHHAYTKNDVLDILGQARGAGAKAILCTPKDAVKLGEMCTEDFWQFDLSVEFGPSLLANGATFDVWWEEQFNRLKNEMAGHGGQHG